MKKTTTSDLAGRRPGGTKAPGDRLVRIPAEWAWHYAKLQSLRERLLENRESEMAGAAAPLEPHSMDPADSATDEFDHEMALCLLAHERDAVCEVDAAIGRILAGSYGVCEETGQPIPAERLRVVPWTRYTKQAKERREREHLDESAGIPPLQSIQEADAAMLADAEDPDKEELLTREVTRHQRDAVLSEGGPAAEEGEEPSEPGEPPGAGEKGTEDVASSAQRGGRAGKPPPPAAASRGKKPGSSPVRRRSSRRP